MSSSNKMNKLTQIDWRTTILNNESYLMLYDQANKRIR
jgi:hypothetical protein